MVEELDSHALVISTIPNKTTPSQWFRKVFKIRPKKFVKMKWYSIWRIFLCVSKLVFFHFHKVYCLIWLLYFRDIVILSSDKRVIMKIITSAQVMYYFTSAKHEWNNTLRVHKWLFSLSRVYQTTITLSYYLFNNCFKYNFHYLRGWQWMNSLSPLVWIMNSLSSLVVINSLSPSEIMEIILETIIK